MTSQNPGPMEGTTTPSLGAFLLGPHVTVALHAGTPRPTRERNVPQRAHRSLAWSLCKSQVYPSSERPDSSTTSFPALCPRTTNVAPPDTQRFPQALTLAMFNFHHLRAELGSWRAKAGHLSPSPSPTTTAVPEPGSPDPRRAVPNRPRIPYRRRGPPAPRRLSD